MCRGRWHQTDFPNRRMRLRDSDVSVMEGRFSLFAYEIKIKEKKQK